MTEQPSPQPSGRHPRSFHVVVKPIGAQCNLGCTYCYYLHKDGLLADGVPHRIADDLLEEFIRQYIAGQEVEEVTFNWHGGEPMLLGLDFFRKVVELQRKYAGATSASRTTCRPTACCLDDAWCEFLKEHRFYVGLSIDGPKHLHDQFRKGKGGSPTFDEVYRAARLLQKYEVPFSPMTVVHSVNARHPAEVYRFLTEDLGCTRLQWLPCVEPKDFSARRPGPLGPGPNARSGNAGGPAGPSRFGRSRTGRSIPTTGESSSAGRSSCGSKTAWGRLWSTGLSPRWASG